MSLQIPSSWWPNIFFNEVMKVKWVEYRFSDHSTHFYNSKKKNVFIILEKEKCFYNLRRRKKKKKMAITTIFFSFSKIVKNFSSKQINIFLSKEQPRRVSGGGFVAIINSSISCHIFHTSFEIYKFFFFFWIESFMTEWRESMMKLPSNHDFNPWVG